MQLGFNSYESVQGIVFPSNVMFRPPQQYPLGKISSQRYNARYRWNPNDNDLVNLSFNLWATTLGSEDPADTGLGKRAIIDSKGWGGELWNSSIIETSAGRLTLTYGAEYSSTDSERESEYPPAAPVVQTYGRREIGGVYFKGALELTKWLTIDAGARYDAFKSSGASLNNYYDWATPPYLFTTMLSGGLEAEAFSPSAGVTIMPWDGVQLFARFAEGWRPPSIVEAVGSGSEAGIIPNLALRPEQSTGWEVGINIRRDSVFLDGDKLRAKVAYFDNDYTDYIARRLDLQTGNAMFINLPGAKISGYEASLSYDMGHVFAEGRFNYFDNVEYCYNEPTYGLSGCSAHAYPGDWRGGYVQPKYSGSVTVGTRLFDERLTLGARVNFFGSSAIDLPPWNSTDLPVVWAPEEIYDAFASYKVTDAASLNLSVENLMDRYYISPLAVAQIPSPGRTATLTFELKF